MVALTSAKDPLHCTALYSRRGTMAVREKIRLVSEAGTGYFYTTTKNKQKTPQRLELKKYNPFLRRHTLHKETR